MECPQAVAAIQASFAEPLQVARLPVSTLGWGTTPAGPVDVVFNALGRIAYLAPIRGEWHQVQQANKAAVSPFLGVLEDALVFGAAVHWQRIPELCRDEDPRPLEGPQVGPSPPHIVGPGWAEWKGLWEPVDQTKLLGLFADPQLTVISGESVPRREGGTFARFILTRQSPVLSNATA